MSLGASDVAKCILSLVDEDCGDTISNLKLQKLLYYCQGVYLAIYGTPLFNEHVCAWKHGPVVPLIWHEYKEFGARAIPSPSDAPWEDLSPEQEGVIREVFDVFGQFSAWKLRNMTHDEPPWRNASEGHRISHESMRDYFQTILESDDDEAE